MGDWAEWMPWADRVDAITQTPLHFTSSFKRFSAWRKLRKCSFSVRRDQCGTKKVLFFSSMWLIGCGCKNGKVLFSATLVANKRKQSTRICLQVCAPRFCFKVCALWKSILPGKKPTKLGQLQPTYGLNNRASYKTKVKTESKMVFYKKMEKKYKQSLPNQSINHRITWESAEFAAKTGCADFKIYPRTFRCFIMLENLWMKKWNALVSA